MKKTSSISIGILSIVVLVGIAKAAIPVIDSANLMQSLAQVKAWAVQYQQMIQQYELMSGSRGMANIANDPSSRQYLPPQYSTMLLNGYNNSDQIRKSSQQFDINTTKLGKDTDTVKAYEFNAQRTAVNQASTEAAYSMASNRFVGIQSMLDKLNDVPDSKDTADLSARIQAEQAMLQNENIKLAMVGQISQAQRDLAMQSAAERRIKSTRGKMPNW